MPSSSYLQHTFNLRLLSLLLECQVFDNSTMRIFALNHDEINELSLDFLQKI